MLAIWSDFTRALPAVVHSHTRVENSRPSRFRAHSNPLRRSTSITRGKLWASTARTVAPGDFLPRLCRNRFRFLLVAGGVVLAAALISFGRSCHHLIPLVSRRL